METHLVQLFPIACQEDTHSCGVLAINALTHFIQPTKFPLLSSSDTDIAHLHYGNAVVEHHVISSQSPSLPPTSVSITPLSSTIPSSSPPASESVLPTTIPHESSVSTPSHGNKNIKQVAPIFKLKKQSHADMLDDDSDTSEFQFRGQLVDIKLKKHKNANGKTLGRPHTNMLEKVTRQCHELGQPKKQWYRCIGENCRYSLAAPANRKRLLKHAASCHRLPITLHCEVTKLLASESLGAQVEKLEAARGEVLQTTNPSPMAYQDVESTTASVVGVVVEHSKSRLEVECNKVGREYLKAWLDLAIVKLICAAAIPPTLVDYVEWKEIFLIANKAYHPSSGNLIADKHIPGEAAHVRILSIEFLKTRFNLTISYDGSTMKRPQSAYMVHFTTPDGCSFLIEGEESSDTSHTGEHIAHMLLNAMDLVSCFCFSGIASDNTSNTRVARQLVFQAVKTVIPMSDACHHLNLVFKDIAKLPMFKDMISQLRSLVTYFCKLTQAYDALECVRLQKGITRGIEEIGKTRFATICAAAISVQHCLPALRELVDTGPIKFLGKKANLASIIKSGSHRGLNFELGLACFIDIQGPIAKAIVCLESMQTNVADVYKYWFAICGCIKQLFEDSLRVSMSKRWAKFMLLLIPAFMSSSKMDQLTAILRLCYVDSAILHNPLSLKIKIPHIPSTAAPDILTSQTYVRVFKYLKIVIEAEFKSQHNPTLKGKTAADVCEAFVHQFERYMKGQYPFDTMMDAGQNILSYWTHLTKMPEGSILACIAEQLYSIKPSSVPEERTMSVFMRMNTPDRNHQHVHTLVDMTQIQQWHMYDPKKMVERQHPDISFSDLNPIISTPKESAACQSHEPTGSYLSVGTDEQEEILEDEEDMWLDEMLVAKPAEDSAFDIKADANLHAPIVTKALVDECEESPINGLGGTQGDATEDDADREGIDTKWDGFW
ncbi:hypothetical protein BDR05DRAFT_998906 [Suillus weaverae]|nr:hypothetical protein BDR05DRAFT_998906 [Suillus weaverae]